MSSSTASEMMLMWFQTQRFVELLQSYFFVSFRGMQLMLTEFFFFLPSEHQEAFENSLQQVPSEYGSSSCGEDFAFR